MTRNFTMAATAALLASTGLVNAGGIDRNGFNISPIFETGEYGELSFSYASPSVSGTWPLNGAASGDMASDYATFGLAYHRDLSDQLSLTFVVDQPFGAAVSYDNADPYVLGLPPSGYPANDFNATLTSTSASAYLRYEIDDRISVYGGLRYVVMSGQINMSAGGVTGAGLIFLDQTFVYEPSAGIGYTVGAAYEIPEIALRASLTYHSATSHENTIDADPALTGQGPVDTTSAYSLPQVVALDVQTGVAEGTLVLASLRWTDWSEADIPTHSGLATISNDDAWTYSAGVARRLTDDFAVLGRVTYEAASGDLASNLSPVDGSTSFTLAGIFDVTEDTTITAGINYTMLGDATTEFLLAEFSGNSAWGLGVRVGMNF